jgi:HlyD family secretion protein
MRIRNINTCGIKSLFSLLCDTKVKKDVEIGLSDGINVEIKEGVKEGDKIKVWNKVREEETNEENN